MLPITKNSEPKECVEARTKPHASYATLPKDVLRKSLLEEQGYLCAYCMTRIEDDSLNTKIEHWQSVSAHSSRQMDYSNLLVVCSGGQGQPPKHQHCDTHKANQSLSINPADSSDWPKMKISYRRDGTILSKNPQLNEEINSILNLNIPMLKNNRKAVRKRVEHVLQFRKAKDVFLQYQKESHRKIEYCGVAIQYLQRKLR